MLAVAGNEGAFFEMDMFFAVDGVDREDIAAMIEVLGSMDDVVPPASGVADAFGVGMDVDDIADLGGKGTVLGAEMADGQDMVFAHPRAVGCHDRAVGACVAVDVIACLGAVGGEGRVGVHDDGHGIVAAQALVPDGAMQMGHGNVSVLAAGNNGVDDAHIGTRGVYIGFAQLVGLCVGNDLCIADAIEALKLDVERMRTELHGIYPFRSYGGCVGGRKATADAPPLYIFLMMVKRYTPTHGWG